MLGPMLIRHLIYTINFVFVLTGCTLISFGIATKLFYQRYGDLIPAAYIYHCYYLIAMGFVIFAVVVLGWYGALSDNSVITLMFSSCLLLVFFMEVTAAVGGYFLRETAYHSLTSSLNVVGNASSDAGNWDNLQNDFKCCGIQSADDWDLGRDALLPDSCCHWRHSSNGNNNKQTTKCSKKLGNSLNKSGCFKMLGMYLRDYSLLFIILSVIAACFQIFGLLMVCHLTSQFRKGYQTMI